MEVRTAAIQSEVPEQYPIPDNKRILEYKAMLGKERQKQTA